MLAETIRQGIASHSFIWGQNKIQLTLSIGLESQNPGTLRVSELFNQLLREADDNMIQAKKSGYNRIYTEKLAESSP